MPLDPQLAAVLAFAASADPQAFDEIGPDRARAALREMTHGLQHVAPLPQVGSVEECTVPGPGGPLPARLYRPVGNDVDGRPPLLVFLHGGGFVIGDLDTHDDQARLLSRNAGFVVLSVAYRLAPEAPFPAGYDDAVAAVRWALGEAAGLGADPDRVLVGGDSAGGNLAAAAALAARDEGLPLAGQLLIYPAVDQREVADYPSRADNAEGYFLTEADMRWFHRNYLGTGAEGEAAQHDWRASPLLADLTAVAPAVVAVAEYDPLRDEGIAYAKALAEAGVEVRLLEYPGLIHGFFGMGTISAACASAVQEICTASRDLLAAPRR